MNSFAEVTCRRPSNLTDRELLTGTEALSDVEANRRRTYIWELYVVPFYCSRTRFPFLEFVALRSTGWTI